LTRVRHRRAIGRGPGLLDLVPLRNGDGCAPTPTATPVSGPRRRAWPRCRWRRRATCCSGAGMRALAMRPWPCPWARSRPCLWA
jgi:hypothetical protein